MVETRKFPHHMIKEIFEQPQGLHDTIAPRISLPEGVVQLNEVPIRRDELRALQRINIVASGTSRHAGMVGQYMIQELAGIPVDVDYASEFEYRNPMIGQSELTIVITQSGETADTGAAQREAKARGSRTVAISNVAGTTIAREADGVIYTLAGPEISIASTKAFTAQMAALFLFALHLAQARETLPKDRLAHYIRELLDIPGKLKTLLACAPHCEQIATEFHKVDDFLFLGRAIHYPVALDGALKLKEVSYVHAEAYQAAELKHGPLALINSSMPSVVIVPSDDLVSKNVSTIEQIKARGGPVIAVTSADLPSGLADAVVRVPRGEPELEPLLLNVPLQLLAYHVAAKLGRDIDKPRNLAKSVTVE